MSEIDFVREQGTKMEDRKLIAGFTSKKSENWKENDYAWLSVEVAKALMDGMMKDANWVPYHTVEEDLTKRPINVWRHIVTEERVSISVVYDKVYDEEYVDEEYVD